MKVTTSTKVLAFWLLMLLYPMPTFLSDVVHQKSYLLFFLCFFAFIFLQHLSFSFFRGVSCYLLLPLTWVMLCIFINVGHVSDWGDVLTELLRYALCPVLFIGCLFSVDRPWSQQALVATVARLIKWFVLIESIICIISLVYPSSRDLFSLVFNTRKMMNSSYLIGVRMTGTFENPNYLGFVSFLVFVVYRLIVYKTDKISSRCLVMGLLFTLVLLTGSRTALAAMLLFLICTSRWLVVGLLLASPLFVAIIADSRYAVLLSGDLLADESFAIRYGIVMDAIRYIIQRPIFGYAENPLVIADNTFVTIVVRYGFPFLFVLAFSKLWLYLSIVRRRFNRQDLTILFLFNVGLPIFLWTGEFLDNFRLFMIYSTFELLLLFYLKARGDVRE